MSISQLVFDTSDSGAARKLWTKGLGILRAFTPLAAHHNAWPRHAEYISTRAPHVPPSADIVALKPHMADDELALFESLLGRANHVLEYGCGGSTALAASYRDLRLSGVESDPVWLRKVEAHPAVKSARTTGRFVLHHVNIGPTKKWGKPSNDNCRHVWPLYSSLPWSRQSDYDLIFVDGRFRVACILHAVLKAQRDALIVIHDFWDRPHYHGVLPFLDLKKSSGTLGVFQKRHDIDKGCVESLIERYKFISD
jgi:hypothetical protein